MESPGRVYGQLSASITEPVDGFGTKLRASASNGPRIAGC